MFTTVDIDRIERRLDALWDIGKTSDGGVTRIAYSPEENRAIEYVLDELSEEYTVETDSIGNVFASREPDANQSLYIGSHLDSVYNGGRLDGTLGVVAAMEAIEAVYATDEEPTYPPTLTIFRAEESARFGQHTIGSRGALGMLTVDEFSATDQNDIPLWKAMQQAGFQPGNLSEATIDTERVVGFLETHIEQGRVLDEENENVGIVTGIRAPVRYRTTIYGNYDHSGATPMSLRNDALAGCADMITSIERIGREAAQDGDVVATVGDVTSVDGAMNKVCGEVSFPIDVRSNDVAYRDSVEERIVDRLEEIADERNLSIEMDLLDRSTPVDLDERMGDTLEAGANAVSASNRRLPSGGGHDAMNFQLNDIPTGLVFVPSVDGVSHNPREETDPEAIVDAAKTLAYALSKYS